MAKLPSTKKLLVEDFTGDEKKWISRLLSPINQFFEDVTRALNQQITFSENLSAVVKTVVIDGNWPVKFKWDLKSKPTAAWIGQHREVSEIHTIPTDPLYMDWEFSADGMFQVNSVVNSTATSSNKFNLTVIAITG